MLFQSNKKLSLSFFSHFPLITLDEQGFYVDKYFMRINEVISPLKKFIATVSVKGTQAKTMIDAESQSQARLLLGKQYGEKNVVSVSHINLDEQQTVTATPSQLKHEKVVNYLTNKITRIKNRPKVTQQDVHTAVERYKTRQKRANLELEKQQELQQARDK